MVVIAYHSNEDRPVKHRFRDLGREPRFDVATPRPEWPGEIEIAENRRSRSARLRALRRVRDDPAEEPAEEPAGGAQ